LGIWFHSEDIQYSLPNKRKTKSWLHAAALEEGCKIKSLNYIFCSDNRLLEINQEHLKHDFYTDVITFEYSNSCKSIEGDVFLSIERIQDNARKYAVPLEEELKRVMIHGLLHLLGYTDTSKEEQRIMRQKEDYYLNLFKKSFT